MRMITTSILQILFYQLLTRVSYVSSQSTANTCTQNSMAVEDQESVYSGVKMYFGHSYCQRIIQEDVTNAVKNACTWMNATQEQKDLTKKIDSLDTKVDDVYQRLTSLILTTSKPTCTKGYEYYQPDKFWYKFHIECRSWTEARQICQQEGGDLISLNNNSFEFFQNLSKSKAGSCEHVWVGTTDMPLEGTWKWLNGENVSSVFWKNGQPDNYDQNENCGDLVLFEYRLNDNRCSNEEHFICQII